MDWGSEGECQLTGACDDHGGGDLRRLGGVAGGG